MQRCSRLRYLSRNIVRFRLPAVILLLALIALPLGCRSQQGEAEVTVVTTTSLLETIVKEVGGDKVEVASLVMPSQCPGTGDLKPRGVEMLAEADLFLWHGWPGEAFVESELFPCADNPDLEPTKIAVEGNSMTPGCQAEAVDKITAALSEVNPANKAYYEENASEIKEFITEKGNEIEGRLDAAGTTEVKVICAQMQIGFVQWAGFDIVDSYVPDPTAAEIQSVIDTGKTSNVTLVIDNLQSGTDVGATIAAGIPGAKQVILSNFPGGFEDTDTWGEAIEGNVNRLLNALG